MHEKIIRRANLYGLSAGNIMKAYYLSVMLLNDMM